MCRFVVPEIMIIIIKIKISDEKINKNFYMVKFFSQVTKKRRLNGKIFLSHKSSTKQYESYLSAIQKFDNFYK